jgi:hypothetical protein
MALYQNIVYTKEALKVIIEPDVEGDYPDTISEMGREFPVYRDQRGYYIFIPTAHGQQRVGSGEWVVLEQGIEPEVPAVPAVNAIGSVTVTGIAAGDGMVGFEFKGVIYTVTPEVDATPEETATALALVLAEAGNLIPTVTGTLIDLVAKPNKGTWYNKPLTDMTTETVQDLVTVGMDGGSFYIPSVPAKNEYFSVWTDANFLATYEPS